MYMANLWSLVCFHELFYKLAKTEDICFFILNSLLNICHWIGEFHYSSNSKRGWNMVSLCNNSHCNAKARLDIQWCWISPYLWQQKHYIWYGAYSGPFMPSSDMFLQSRNFQRWEKEPGEEIVSNVFPVNFYATIRLKELVFIRVFAYDTCWTSTKWAHH